MLTLSLHSGPLPVLLYPQADSKMAETVQEQFNSSTYVLQCPENEGVGGHFKTALSSKNRMQATHLLINRLMREKW